MDRYFEDEYFQWLSALVKNKSHRRLLRLLFETSYIFRKPMDENRAEDGIQLRYEFLYERGIDERDFPYLHEPCNLFEMIFALARRLSLIMEGPCYQDDSDIWFWRMVSNLGLGKQIHYPKLYGGSLWSEWIREFIPHYQQTRYVAAPDLGAGNVIFE